MSPKTASVVRKAAALLLLLTFSAPDGRMSFTDESVRKPFRNTSVDGTIRCVIETGGNTAGRHKFFAGICHEMLTRFAGENGCRAEITLAKEGADYADSLIRGSIDILVRRSGDTLSNPLLKHTRSIGDCTWYLRSDRVSEIKEINLWSGPLSEEYIAGSRFAGTYDPSKIKESGARRLSPYDDLIRKYAKKIGWDWRLLAAMIYQESRFSIAASSPRGASGLMQILPRTASHYGITDLLDPEQNIIAGTMHIERLQKSFPEDEFSPEDRTDFTLAAYNAGRGRIADCRHIAESEGLDSRKWENVVKIIPSMKTYSIEEGETARQGYFNGEETVSYVGRVHGTYDAFREIFPE